VIPPTHNRHTTRLPGYDYTQPGGYYVTIVTRGREPVLGAVVAGSVALSIPGVIVQKAWCDLPQHFANVRLDEFVIMPNHVHGIIMIVAGDRVTPGETDGFCRGRSVLGEAPVIPTTDLPLRADRGHGLPEIVRAFKSFSARRINTIQNTPGQPCWQRNYYEHIIRSETELQKIRQYIRNNPRQWELDAENPHTP